MFGHYLEDNRKECHKQLKNYKDKNDTSYGNGDAAVATDEEDDDDDDNDDNSLEPVDLDQLTIGLYVAVDKAEWSNRQQNEKLKV